MLALARMDSLHSTSSRVMKPDVKTEWVAALRSGQYKRGRYQLRDNDDRYDPLGVLCELAIKAGVGLERRQYDRSDGKFFGWTYRDPNQSHALATGLPEAVCAWSGLSYREGYRIAMASDKGMNFKQVADLVEKSN